MFTDAYWPRVNGVTVSVDSFARALIRQGHQVLIICSSYPESCNLPPPLMKEDDRDDAPRVVRVPSLPAFVTKEDRIAKFTSWHWVFRKVEEFNPQIIHINTEIVIAEFGYLYAKVHNLPAIYTFHTMWEDYGPNYFPMFPPLLVRYVIRRVLKIILARSYRVIVPTPQIDEVVRKYRPGIETFLLPTGIDPAIFDHSDGETAAFREKFEARYPEIRGKRLLLFAGRVVKEKNIGFLLRLLPGLLERRPEVMLVIAGNGPDLEYYQEEARKAGVTGHCVFTGYMEREDLSLVYRISEIFLFPSLTDTQGLVTLEAMRSGTPVVAIGALGTLMVMGGDNGGFMVKNDSAEFSRRVLELLEDPDLYRKKAAEARIHAQAWSIDEVTKRLVGIYEASIEAYREEYGDPKTPVWELLIDKRWWKVNRKIFMRKAVKKLRPAVAS
jgi:glycosyltransferase involved in cell wall biosynthesis